MYGVIVTISESFQFPLRLSLFKGDSADTFKLGMASTQFREHPGFESVQIGEYVTLPSKQLLVPAVECADIFQMIETLSIAASPPYTGGMDGTTYKVEIYHWQSSVHWQWWGRTPPEPWGALGDLSAKIFALAISKGLPPHRRERRQRT